MMENPKVAVIGAGAFGTALAAMMALGNKADVTLVGRDPLLMADLQNEGLHQAALPGIALPDALRYCAEPSALHQADIVLFAMPSQAQADAARQYGPYLAPEAIVVTCAKGIDRQHGRLLSELLEAQLPSHRIAVLSGPGFAVDIARGLPTAMVIAARELNVAQNLAHIISTTSFRLYPSDDRIGVQIGGALKNVLAIACGIVEGAGIGDSARATLISRGLAEISRFAVAKGGRSDTVRGLSGLGDLVLTSTSHHSRNLRYGIAVGQGHKDEAGRGILVEGAITASVASRLAPELGVELPITDAVSAIIEDRLSITKAVEQLMTRPIKTE